MYISIDTVLFVPASIHILSCHFGGRGIELNQARSRGRIGGGARGVYTVLPLLFSFVLHGGVGVVFVRLGIKAGKKPRGGKTT